MATAVLGSRVRKGSARPFIGRGEGEGELGREQPGQGVMLGEDADSARGAAAILVARAGEERGRGELRGAREGGLGQYQGRTRWSGPGARHLSAQVAGAGVRRRQWTGCREAGG